MPKVTQSKKGQQTKPNPRDVEDAYVPGQEDVPDSPMSNDEVRTVSAKAGKKRSSSSFELEEDETQDYGNEMQKMLECFGADISKTLMGKRKRLEQFTQISLKNSNKRVEEIWKSQQTERQKLNEEFHRQVSGVFQQWETDMDKSKEQDEKLNNLFRQQQKLFQQTRVVLSGRLKTIRQLHDQYTSGMENLEQCHSDQKTGVQAELKKEMSLLQKKILMDTQQQEMASFKKNLQTMLL